MTPLIALHGWGLFVRDVCTVIFLLKKFDLDKNTTRIPTSNRLKYSFAFFFTVVAFRCRSALMVASDWFVLLI